jgi:hypothetical protein
VLYESAKWGKNSYKLEPRVSFLTRGGCGGKLETNQEYKNVNKKILFKAVILLYEHTFVFFNMII